MYGSFASISNLINKNPESPRFKAVRSLLFNTQIVAVAEPGKWVLRKPIYLLLILKMLVTKFKNISWRNVLILISQ